MLTEAQVPFSPEHQGPQSLMGEFLVTTGMPPLELRGVDEQAIGANLSELASPETPRPTVESIAKAVGEIVYKDVLLERSGTEAEAQQKADYFSGLSRWGNSSPEANLEEIQNSVMEQAEVGMGAFLAAHQELQNRVSESINSLDDDDDEEDEEGGDELAAQRNKREEAKKRQDKAANQRAA